jgi:hypothetical protein
MSQRIKELYEQAWTMVSDEERKNGELYDPGQQQVRRNQVFAELIVEECLSVAQSEHRLALEFKWDCEDTGQGIIDSIKEHFSVKCP